MEPVSYAKALQLLITGILQVVFGSGTFVLVYILYGGKFGLDGEILNQQAAYWTAIPMVVVGLAGVLAGITKENCLVTLYLIGSSVSCVLGGFVCVVAGVKVSTIRLSCGEDADCKNSSMVMLLGTLVLIASVVVAVALWAAVKACQAKWGPSKKTQALRVVSSAYRVNGAAKGEATVMFSHPPPQNTPANAIRGIDNPIMDNQTQNSDRNDNPPIDNPPVDSSHDQPLRAAQINGTVIDSSPEEPKVNDDAAMATPNDVTGKANMAYENQAETTQL